MIQIVVLLYVGDGGIEALRAHEAEMVPLIYRHGGQIVSASHPSAPRPGDPDEIHILQFPDMQAFDDFRNDADWPGADLFCRQSLRGPVEASGYHIAVSERQN